MLNNAPWPPEHDNFLRERFEAGDSFSKIAAALWQRFAVTRTRNGCIGRAHRLGLKDDGRRPTRTAPRNKTPASRATSGARFSPSIAPEPFICQEAEDIDPLHVSVLDLAPGACKFPYGDGPITFCGHAVLAGSYCEAHHRIAYGRKAQELSNEERERRRKHGIRMGLAWSKKRRAA